MGGEENILRRIAREAKEVMAETLWPTRCAICDAHGSVLCAACEAKLPFIDAVGACARCGAPYGAVQCTECTPATLALHGRTSFPLDGMAHCLLIDDAAKRIVTVLKDHDELRLAQTMALHLVRYIPPAWQHGAALTFIPASHEALRRRGFDHAELIAQALAELSSLPLRRTLDRPRKRDQRALSRQGRVGNLSHAFSVRDAVELPRRLIVVDDICTTGATLYSAADALRDAGCKRIYGLTYGHVLD